MLNFTKSADGLTFIVSVGSRFAAEQFEYQLIAMTEADPVNDIGDRTAHNAITAAYRAEAEAIQQQIDDLDVQNNPERGLAEKQAALVIKRDGWYQKIREMES